MGTERIAQIMPAIEGWRAIRSSTEDKDPPDRWAVPLVGWALVRRDGEDSIEGMILVDGSSVVVTVDGLHFDGYLTPDDLLVDCAMCKGAGWRTPRFEGHAWDGKLMRCSCLPVRRQD